MNRPDRSSVRVVVIPLILFLASAVPVVAQQVSTTRVQITGQVVGADTGVALRRARIEVTSSVAGVEPVFSDDDGRFVLTLPSPAPVTITATKAGYAATSTPSTGKPAADLRVVMSRGGVISGRILESNGAPAVATYVVARRLDAGGATPGARTHFRATTDDLGEYRLGGLPAGRYAVGARWPVRALTFSSPVMVNTIVSAIPGTGAAQIGDDLRQPLPVVAEAAQPIELRAGDDARGVDVVLPRQPTMGDMRAEAFARSRELAIEQGRQPPPQPFCGGNSVVVGRVLTTTGEPLAGVSVRIGRTSGVAVALSTETTDRGGAYAFTCLQPGDYTLEAARPGHVPPTGIATHRTAVPVPGNQTVAAPDFVFQRAGAATGTIVDEHGEPLEGVTVRALQVRYARGRMAASPAGAERRTDDRGHYRVFDLSPGQYLVVASVDASLQPRGRDALGYAPLYYPGATAIDAAVQVQAGPGVDLAGLNLVFRPSVAARVSGTAVDASGAPLAGSVLLAVSHRSGAVAPDPIVVSTGPGGGFAIPNVPPGDYVVHAIATPGPGRSAEFGSEYVSVTGRHPDPLVVRTSTGATLEGRLVIEGGQPQDVRNHSFTLMAYPVDIDRAPFTGRGSGLVIGSDGTFYAVGLYGPRRLALPSAPPEWYVKSVTINGTDVTDTGFDLTGVVGGAEIVVSTAGASLTGRAVDDRDRPAAASVAVIPVQRNLWTPHSRYLKHAQTNGDGSFEIAGLPPGDYWITAVDVLETGPGGDEWQSPAVLDALASGADRVTLGESERHAITLRVIRRSP